MGAINIKHTGSGADIALSSDGTSLLLDGTAIGGGGASNYTIDQKTSAYTIVSGDLGKVIEVTASSNTTITLPEISGSGIGSGFYVTIWNQSGNAVTVSRSGTDQINPNTSSNADTSDNLSSGASKTYVANSASRWIAISSSPYFYDENNVNNGNTRPQASGISSIAIGRSTLSSATNSIAIGGSSGFTGASASANGSVALSGSRAHGTDSLAMGINNNTTSYGSGGANSVALSLRAKASQSYAFAQGYEAQATANSAVALGFQAQATSSTGSVALGYKGRATGTKSLGVNNNTSGGATANNATAIGDTCLASGVNSVAIGNANTANANSAFALGRTTHVNGVFGKFVYGCNSLTGNYDGSSQTGMHVLCADTTDATAEALTANNSSASTDNQVIVQNNSAYAFHGTIVARESAASGTDCAAWKVEGLIRREANAGTTVLVNSATTVLNNAPSWGMALSADTTNGCLKIAVTGAASTNIRWVATINTSEVTYA